MSKKVINPTSKDIEVKIEGKSYLLPADGELSGVKDTHAAHWKERIHHFIILEDEVSVPAKKEEAKEEDKEDVKEEVEIKKEESKEEKKESPIAKAVRAVKKVTKK